MDLTEKDRLMIANQLKILERLYPEEADHYAKQRKAIEDGYKLHYGWLLDNFSEEMSEEECREVLDILEMYRAIHFSFRDLIDKLGLDERKAKFPGFDGNNESRQFSYTLYFVVDLDRYGELRYGAEYPDFNSHTPMLDKYRKMLRIWKTFPDKVHLSGEQIKKLIEA